jgi:hypothetical protein
MAVTPAKLGDISVNSVAVECNAQEFSFVYSNQLADVGTFCSSGPRQLVGNNTWNVDMSGPNDFTSAAYDDTIFPLRNSSGFAFQFQPTGSTGAAATPEYNGTVVLAGYTIRGSNGQAWMHQTQFAGNSSIARDAT